MTDIQSIKATDFHNKLYEFVNENYTHLQMREPLDKVPKGSTTFWFKPGIFNKKSEIILAFIASKKTNAKIEFSNKSVEEIKEKYDKILFHEMYCDKAEKSAAIRIKTEEVDILKDFDSQIKLIKEVIDKVNILYNWAEEHLKNY